MHNNENVKYAFYLYPIAYPIQVYTRVHVVHVVHTVQCTGIEVYTPIIVPRHLHLIPIRLFAAHEFLRGFTALLKSLAICSLH